MLYIVQLLEAPVSLGSRSFLIFKNGEGGL